ncbi:hypothetical protein QE441_003756 [Chryseobacterium sp. SORGH_AS909]|uniref:Uncharacterized protein n=1 Tax=Chryseobacterium camelliae TaxID=1265445 RepID=A0ABU0TK62_9FLAO|nr:hypothetical protein [Chryseobacterium camelliae]MDQ1100624.1 hypothetical protein [Chryseobacterium sp. SORGH_AS_1048]MDR6087962.1 hypothetical protein [Chryseobacterium sp. SORGH_AS_0909]MDR6132336.1 hypothetical protein [Chryseobacterium sp. SORGH_AS_1175]MDT3409455.1 hypothetical protein [Pseudacidovorax intermedius]
MTRHILISGLFCIMSCSKKARPIIIGTNISYEQSRLLLENSKNLEQQKTQILVLVNGRECSWDHFSSLLKKGKIKTFTIVKDPLEIQKVQKPSGSVKALLLATQ